MNLSVFVYERGNLVRSITSVHLTLKDPIRFGRSYRRSLENGVEYSLPLQRFYTFYPSVLRCYGLAGGRIAQELMSSFENDDVSLPNFLKCLRHLSLINCGFSLLDLETLIAASAQSLESLEFYDATISDENRMVEALNIFKRCSKIKAFDILHTFSPELFELYLAAFGPNLAILRFSSTPGMRIRSFLATKGVYPGVRMVAFQDMAREEGEGGGSFAGVGVAEHITKTFPNLACMVLDWMMISEELTWDSVDERVVVDFMTLHRRLNLTFTAVIIYTPADDMRQAAVDMADSINSGLRCENRRIGSIPTRIFQFNCASSGQLASELVDGEMESIKPNFSLIICGDQSHPMSERLKSLIVDRHISSPDLVDFCHIFYGPSDSDDWTQPDLRMEIGGFETRELKERIANESTGLSVEDMDIRF